MGPGGDGLDLGGGGGADEDFIDIRFPNPNNRPNFGAGLSVGGNPLFAGKGFGGGGFGIMDLGGEFTRSMMASNPNFIPSLYGLKGSSADYLPGGKYGIRTEDSMPSGGYTQRADTNPEGTEMTVTAMKQEANTPLQGMLEMGMDPSFLDPSGIGSLSPTTPTAFEPQTGIFGGTFGPKLKNAFPPKLREFLGNVASIHPATMNPAFVFKMIKGYQGAKDKGAFLKKVGTGLAMRKMMGNFGLDRTQKALVGTGMNIARGEQNWQQGVGSFITNAGFGEIMKNFGPKAYQSGGMPAVYALMSAVKMMRQRAQRRVRSGLAGPGGGG